MQASPVDMRYQFREALAAGKCRAGDAVMSSSPGSRKEPTGRYTYYKSKLVLENYVLKAKVSI